MKPRKKRKLNTRVDNNDAENSLQKTYSNVNLFKITAMPFMSYAEEVQVSDEIYQTMYMQHYGMVPVFVNGKPMRHVLSLGIVNNVVTATLKKSINLQVLKEKLSYMGAEYSSLKKFPSLGLHFAFDGVSQRAAVNVFSTGKIVCPGCPTKAGGEQAIRKTVGLIEAYIPGVSPAKVVVRNIVGCVRLDVGINLDILEQYIKNRIGGDTKFRRPKYESEDFPGLQWLDSCNRMFLVFTSGAIVITNGREANDIIKGATYMHSILYDCWKDYRLTFRELKEKET